MVDTKEILLVLMVESDVKFIHCVMRNLEFSDYIFYIKITM